MKLFQIWMLSTVLHLTDPWTPCRASTACHTRATRTTRWPPWHRWLQSQRRPRCPWLTPPFRPVLRASSASNVILRRLSEVTRAWAGPQPPATIIRLWVRTAGTPTWDQSVWLTTPWQAALRPWLLPRTATTSPWMAQFNTAHTTATILPVICICLLVFFSTPPNYSIHFCRFNFSRRLGSSSRSRPTDWNAPSVLDPASIDAPDHHLKEKNLIRQYFLSLFHESLVPCPPKHPHFLSMCRYQCILVLKRMKWRHNDRF